MFRGQPEPTAGLISAPPSRKNYNPDFSVFPRCFPSLAPSLFTLVQVVVCLVVAGSAVAISWSAKDGLVTAGGDIEQGLVKGGWQIRQGLVEGAKVHGSLLQRGAKEHGTLLQQAILGSGAMIALALWWPRGGGSGGGVGSGAGRVQGGGSGSSI